MTTENETDTLFSDFNIPTELTDALAEKGILKPFPIQEMTLPMALEGADIIGQARTGTGKTLGFGMPLLSRIDPTLKKTQALVIAPTRELAIQVAADFDIGAARGLEVVCIYGGVAIEPQEKALRGGAHVVVGTPGRLLDHLRRRNMDLSNVSELVLDEADEMLDMGFLPDVETLIAACPTERHTMLFSATMPAAIVSLGRRYMQSPTFMHAQSDEPQTSENVEQYFWQVHRMDKPRIVARVLQQPERGGCFVFTRTKHMADRLVDDLKDMDLNAVAVHGDLRQASREKNLDTFRSGKADVLVATEVAARGLDVDNVTHVINYDCPNDHKMYLHRIGRTARAGRKGVAITLTEHNEVAKTNVIRKKIGAESEIEEMFSTSPQLVEWFELPEDLPWRNGKSSKTKSDRSSSKRGGSSKRDDSSKRGGRGSKDRDADRSSRGRDAGGRNKRRSSEDRNDDDRTDDKKSRSSSRSRDNDHDDKKSSDQPKRSRSRAKAESNDSSDDASSRTRTRSRSRSRDTDTGSDTKSSESSSRSRSSSRAKSDDAKSDTDSSSTRTRTRSRSRSTSSDSDSSSSKSDVTSRTRSRSTKSESDSDSGSSSRTRARSKRSSDDDASDSSSDRGRSRSRSGSSRGSSSRNSSSRSSSRSGRSSRSQGSSRSSGSNESTRKGDEARGEGRSRFARSTETEILP